MIGLSIDMDFFARILPEWDFAHSEAFEAGLSEVLWLTRYAFNDLLVESGIHHADIHPAMFLDGLKEKGFTFSEDFRVGVSWSHQHAYLFFVEDPRIKRVLNFDAHHDGGYSDKPGELNCGNWALYLHKMWMMPTQWVVPAWQTMKGEPICPMEELSFKEVGQVKGEICAIFICQSPAWVPPHIDPYFAQLVLDALELSGKDLPDFDKGMITRRMPDLVQIEHLRRDWGARMKGGVK